MLRRSLEERLKAQVEIVRLRHECDVEKGAGYAPVPTSLEHKRQGAAREYRWQFVFGSTVARPDRETGRVIRWYAHPGAVDRSVKQSADTARIGKRVTCIRPGIPSPRTRWRMVMTSARCRSCSATRMSRRQ